MRVLHWGTFDLGKPRTRILRAGIVAAGATLTDCHAPVWEGIEDKTQTRGFWRWLAAFTRWLGTYPGLVARFMQAPQPDVVLTSFPGVFDTIVLAPFARLRGVPIVLDLFISTYDTLAFDRSIVRPRSIAGRFISVLERFAIQCAQLVLLDTETHARRIETLFGLQVGTCGAVMVGAETDVFRPLPREERPVGSALRVLFYGQFIPLHGIETIIEAARLMSQETVHWTLIGKGQEGLRVRRMLEDQPLPSVHWIEWTNYEALPRWIADADVVLGIFGTSEKAASVIPNKVFQALACGQPVITRDSPAIRELVVDAPPCCQLVPAGNAPALAEAVRRQLTLHEIPSGTCHASVRDAIGPEAIGRQFVRIVHERLRVRMA